MYTIIALSAFILLITGGVVSQECSDCMNNNECPEAASLKRSQQNNATLQLFKDAICGYERTGRRIIPKVCCSKFRQNIRISNHENLGLLPARCGDIGVPRIIGGQIADLLEFPWMALISYHISNTSEKSFNCGGSIINERYILTAAHCVLNKRIAGVRVGEYEITKEEEDCYNGVCTKYKDIRVQTSVVHKDYKRESIDNDIALLRLAEPMDFSADNIYPICLPKTAQLRNKPLGDETATVAGWGCTENEVVSSILLKVDIPILSAESCRNFYNRYESDADVTVNKLCAGMTGKDSCNGDSGGPMMVKEKYNNVLRFIQYGVVSYGPIRCGSGTPGLYTDLRKYMGWILDNITP